MRKIEKTAKGTARTAHKKGPSANAGPRGERSVQLKPDEIRSHQLRGGR
jgi:hypothetical protein